MNEETKILWKQLGVILLGSFLGSLIGSCAFHCMHGHCNHHMHIHHHKMFHGGHNLKKFDEFFERKISPYENEFIEEEYIIIPKKTIEKDDMEAPSPFDGPRPNKKR